MRNNFRVYQTSKHTAHDEVKSTFVDLFQMLFFADLERDEDVQRVTQLSQKLNTKSKHFLVQALRCSMEVFFKPSRVKGTYHGILTFKRTKITDILASGLDNQVIAEARRKAHHNNHLKLIQELSELTHDLTWSFNFRQSDSSVSGLKPVNMPRKDVNKKLTKMVIKNFNKLEAITAPQKECNYETTH